MYECEGEGVTGETGEGGEGGTSVLGYFESPAPSSGERGAEKKTHTLTSTTSLHKVKVKV